MKLSLFALLLISSVTNPPAASVLRDAQLDQEFKIKIGQESLVATLKVRFEAVPRDDRCPCGDQCTAFQNAVVLLRLASPERKDKYVVVNTDSKARELQSRGYKISLIGLDPCPKKNGNMKGDEYEATLLVTKSQTATGSSYKGRNAGLQGERKPNFSGTWSLEGADMGPWTPPTRVDTIAHRGRKIEITFKTRVHGRVSNDFYHKTIYYIDGRPNTATRTLYSKDRSTKKIEIYNTSKFRSSVRWDGDKLVFVGEGEESKWELSESGLELIMAEGKSKAVYKRK